MNLAVLEHHEIGFLDLVVTGAAMSTSPGCHASAMWRGDVERVAQLVRDQHRGDASRSRSLMISASMVSEVIGSRPVVGSSYSSSVGLDAMARAIATRRRCPPDSADGCLSMCSLRPTNPSTSSTRCAHLVERQRGLFVELEADVLADGERVEQRAFLEHHADVMAHAHQLGLGHLVDAVAVHPDRAGVGPQQAEHQLQDRRLPAPLAPRKILVWPGETEKVTFFRITLSSKARLTLSNTTTGACGLGQFDGDTEFVQALVRHQNRIEISNRVTKKSTAMTHDRGCDHRVGGRAADALGAAARAQAHVAADRHDHEAEEERLDQAHPDVLR